MPIDQWNTLAVIGIDYHVASLDLRAIYALEAEQRSAIRQAVRKEGGMCVVLCTCHRTEIVAQDISLEHLFRIIAGVVGSTSASVERNVRTYSGVHALRHMMRVATGLESAVLGEAEILGQLRRAIAEARDETILCSLLDCAVRATVHLARVARASTHISSGASSLSAAACAFLRRRLDERSSGLLVIGAGGTARAVVENLRTTWPSERLSIVNRTLEHAQSIAGRCSVIDWSQRHEAVRAADAVIIAVNSREFVIRAADLRAGSICIDLSVPLAIEPCANRSIVTVDDLTTTVEYTHKNRLQAVSQVEHLIEEEIASSLRSRERRAMEAAA